MKTSVCILYVCVCVCVYIYISYYVYTYMYIYVYIYIYIPYLINVLSTLMPEKSALITNIYKYIYTDIARARKCF